MAKLPARGADAVVLDCEDATPPNAKDEGRATARQIAPELIAQGCAVTIRVNGPTSEWFERDIADGLFADLAAVVIPKVETVSGLDRIDALLNAADLPDLGVIAGIETALGVADARSLLAHGRVVAAYFGAEDFIADMGGVRTESNQEVLYARSQVALAGRLAGVPTLDQVVTNFRDDTRFELESAEARALGYGGKLCIHPNQVAIANESFIPSAEEVLRAQRLLAAYDEAVARGISAIDFEGQMVDEPLAAQARRIVSLGA